ncbi:MAG: hypothetical protein ACTSWM_08105 [Alphaproteobacteria bacterium]
MAALMSIAKGYDTELFATTTRALVRRGVWRGLWLASNLPPLSRRPKSIPVPVTTLHALAAVDIVTAGERCPSSLIRANDNW